MRFFKELMPHPAVDWSTLRSVPGSHSLVTITCPWCKEKREAKAADVSRRIRDGTFTGFCYKDRLIQKPKSNRAPLPDHPCVDWNDKRLIQGAKQRLTHVAVTCPSCGNKRYEPVNPIAYHIRTNRFTGRCRQCSGKARQREWVRLSPGRKIDPNKGYIHLTLAAISPEDKWLFIAMRRQKKGGGVMEHRFVMAQMLGRPLTSRELVDHMDGNKLNNSPDNLRLYIRGKNMPGETSGYGTYYHEWQLALAEVERLKKLIAD